MAIVRPIFPERDHVKLSAPSLVRFLRQQGVYLALAAIVAAFFWANGERINLAAVIVYTLSIGNLISFAVERLRFLYAGRPFPYDWMIFIPVLLAVAAPVYVVSTVLVWLIALQAGQNLAQLITTGWKLPYVVTFVFSVLIFLHNTTRERLERRNVELQRSVELGTARIELQERELQRAEEIQRSLLPHQIPQIPGFEVAAAWLPARTVGGDYYDVLRLGGHRLGICIADVVGKGVSAALLMANVQAAVHAFAGDTESPAGLCAKVNRLLSENIAAGKFVSFLYGVLDGDARTFQFCNGGHSCPILASGASVRTLDQGGAVLGVFPDWSYLDSLVELRPGDRLLLFTDGITEASGADGKEFEESGIAAFAQANRTLPARELNNRLLANVTAYCNGQFQDDATLLVIAAN
jgi:sigma-B regulation protein RsbU (phosphoserine phosphatase)